jgi:hypothetical protein
LNTMVFFLSLFPVCEESPQLGASRPYNDDHKRSTEVRECRCFGSDRAPGVAPQGDFWSRTVLSTVARWFVLVARETWTIVYRFGPL